MDRQASFNALANALYRRGVKSQRLAALSKMVGCNRSAKTILRNLRDAGIVNPKKAWVGKWRKRKISGTSDRLLKVALAFTAWCSYAQSGGHWDLIAILQGEKPP